MSVPSMSDTTNAIGEGFVAGEFIYFLPSLRLCGSWRLCVKQELRMRDTGSRKDAKIRKNAKIRSLLRHSTGVSLNDRESVSHNIKQRLKSFGNISAQVNPNSAAVTACQRLKITQSLRLLQHSKCERLTGQR